VPKRVVSVNKWKNFYSNCTRRKHIVINLNKRKMALRYAIRVYFSIDFFAVFIYHFGLDFRSLNTAVFFGSKSIII
jgi:hypothetical protein